MPALIVAFHDTSICVETSLREGFNMGYDVVIISDATASGNKKHYETTLERVRDYYGLVMDIERFKKAVENLDKLRKSEIDSLNEEKFNLWRNSICWTQEPLVPMTLHPQLD